MAKYFTQQQIDIFRECYSLNVTQGNINDPRLLAFVMRSVGYYPTIDEVRLYLKSFSKDRGIDFPTLLEVIYQHNLKEQSPEREIMAAFQASDPGRTGKIPVRTLKQILCGFGETLSQREVDNLLRECGLPNSGSVPYSPIVKTLTKPTVRLPPLPTIRELLKLYNLHAQRRLSQNFLLQPRVLSGVINCAGHLGGRHVVEVGPGPGGLTREMLTRGVAQLAVVEFDRRFLPGLEQLRSALEGTGIQMDIYQQDILRFNMTSLFPDSVRTDWSADTARVNVVGNLPFNVSTPLLTQWMHDVSERRGLWSYGRVPMTLTFQKEVGQRMVADIWSKQRSRLSIMCQAYCEVEYKREIRGSAFLPPPKVDVAVMHLTPRVEAIIPSPFPYLSKLVKAAFQFRQKLLVHCLEPLFPPERADLVIKLFKEAGVQPTKRSIEVSLLEFRDLCSVYERICQLNPGVFEFEFRTQINAPLWKKRKSKQREVLNGETINTNSLRKFLLQD